MALWVGRGSKEMLPLKTGAPCTVQPSRKMGAAAAWCQLDLRGWERVFVALQDRGLSMVAPVWVTKHQEP